MLKDQEQTNATCNYCKPNELFHLEKIDTILVFLQNSCFGR